MPSSPSGSRSWRSTLNIFAREPVRRHSVLADLALAVIAGVGGRGYPVALATLVDRLRAG
jgi:3-dehydroquinate dehydratase-2